MSRPLFTFKNMITKTYKANTNISINVVLPSKKNLHIAFVPLSNGSSVFTTDNEDIQKSVENHYKFGKLFKLHSVHGQSETVETAGKASKNGSSEKLHAESTHNGEDTPANETGRQDEMPQEDAGDNNTTSRKVKVSDIASAKITLQTLSVSAALPCARPRQSWSRQQQTELSLKVWNKDKGLWLYIRRTKYRRMYAPPWTKT